MKSLILSLAILVSGCVSIDATEPRVCDSTTLTFPGAIATSTQSLTIDVGGGQDLVTKVLLVDGQITLADGSDLGFLTEITLGVVSPTGGDDLIIWDSQHNAGTVLSVNASDANLVKYIDSNNKFTIDVTTSTSARPVTSYDLTTTLCVSAEANKTYGL